MARVQVESEITGNVWKVEVSAGTEVAEGDVLIILESMKMEIPVESPVAGTSTGRTCTAGRSGRRRPAFVGNRRVI
jgi:acetyl/propionyl-CoA carboxylase alpha subunit